MIVLISLLCLCLKLAKSDSVNAEFIVVANDTIQAKNLTYNLYTKDNPKYPQIITIDDKNSLELSNFSKNRSTKVIVHGWNGHALAEVNTLTRDSYLAISDVNIICVDWSSDAYGIYDEVVKLVPSVGRALARFIDWLIINSGTTSESFHLIGFSLGAHVISSAGRNCKCGQIDYITGLDPANDHWENSTERISHRDAKYVEIIHTNTKGLGLELPIGHNDFYPNGGAYMPGCVDENDNPCLHSKSYQYFANSIDHTGFMAKQCLNYEEIRNDKCSNLSTLHMGGSKTKPTRGVFYLKTNAVEPYYQE